MIHGHRNIKLHVYVALIRYSYRKCETTVCFRKRSPLHKQLLSYVIVLLGTLSKLRKATISYMPDRLSVSSHGTTRLLRDRFS